MCVNVCVCVCTRAHIKSQCPLHPMHVQNIQDWMQYEVSVFKQYGASNLKVEHTYRNYKPAHKIYINNKHYVNK